MTGKTFNGTYLTNVTLANVSYNPATFTGIIDVASGIALLGTVGTAWSVTNQGTIESTDANSSGFGISLASGGTVANQDGATISGSKGLYIGSAAGTVFNAGQIVASGAGTAVARGVVLLAGYLSNASTGTINSKGNGNAVRFEVGAGTVFNAGTLENNFTSSSAMALQAGGFVTNAAGGLIQGGSWNGIYATAGAVTIANAGSIAGGGVTALGSGVTINGSGAVTNQSGGNIIGAGAGVRISTGAGTVSNAGGISGNPTAASGVGVFLQAGGGIANQSGAVISGFIGIYGGSSGALTVANAGSIAGGNFGVQILGGGMLTNALTGTITGISGAGVNFTSGVGTVVNAGRVTSGNARNGVALLQGGLVSNAATGTIISSGTGTVGNHGVYIGGSIGTVINAGAIFNSSTISAVSLHKGGLIDNLPGGIIGGNGSAIVIYGAASTVINAGLITGGAVNFGAGFTNRVVADPGAVFNGLVNGSNTIGATSISTLELAAGASAGTLSGLGTQFIDFAQTTIDASASWTLTGANTLIAGATLTNDGTLTLSNGTLAGGGSIVNNGSIIVDPSTLTLTALTGTGEVVIDNGSTVTTLGTVTAGETIAFSGGNGDLNLAFATFSGTIAGLDSTDTIDLAGVTDATSAGIVNGNTLQIQRAGNPAILLTLDPTRNYAGGSFAVGGNGAVSNSLGRTLSWTGGGGTAFGSAANWNDISNGSNPAQTAPTATDTVDFDTSGGGVAGTGTVTAVHVGSTGDGVLELGNGATIAADSLDAGIGVGAGGQIGLFGAGTDLIVAGAMVVGESGDGALAVSQGATVTAGSLDVGAAAGGSGGISLSGTGAALNVAGLLTVGDKSSGSLNIANGAIVTAGGLTIGAGAAGSGDVVIGPGSHLNLTGTTINVGLAGSGVLDVQGGTLGLVAGTTLSPGTFGRIVQVGGLIDAAATLDLSGASLGGGGTAEASVEILNTSLATVSGLAETLLAPLITSGDTVNIAGVWSIKSSGTLVLNVNTVDNSQTITFGDTTGELLIGQQVTLDAGQNPGTIAASALSGFAAPIVGYKAGDVIAFSGLTVASDQVVGNVVTMFDAGHGELGSLTFQTAKGGVDNAGATAAAAQIVPCFAAGTLIETVTGPRAVETLRVGDTLVTLLGAPEPIVWVGVRSVNCARHPRPDTVWPVRIARHAFGANVPARDLFVSPDHAIYIDGVLIPAKLLVNGTSIARVKRSTITYYHVELPRHDVILAEGLAVESYLDFDDRANFHANGDTIRMFPDFDARLAPNAAGVWETSGAAPLVVAGPRLVAARAVVARNRPAAEVQIDKTARRADGHG